jgi:hypothetical protein
MSTTAEPSRHGPAAPSGLFHGLWNIGFRPADLARASDDDADLNDESDGGFDEQEIPA